MTFPSNCCVLRSRDRFGKRQEKGSVRFVVDTLQNNNINVFSPALGTKAWVKSTKEKTAAHGKDDKNKQFVVQKN